MGKPSLSRAADPGFPHARYIDWAATAIVSNPYNPALSPVSPEESANRFHDVVTTVVMARE
jgi:hypothetical protein